MSTSRAIHPGEILREEFLAPLDLPARVLAIALHVPARYITDVVRERRNVTPDIAQRLARYFDTAPQFWTNLQASYDAKLARHKPGGRIANQIPPHRAAARCSRKDGVFATAGALR